MTRQDFDMWVGEAAQGDANARARLSRLGYEVELIPATDGSGAAAVVVHDLRQADDCDWREMIDGIHARRGEHIPGAVASNGGASNEFVQYNLDAETRADEGALIALSAMRELTGLDYTRIIKALLREVAQVEMPF